MMLCSDVDTPSSFELGHIMFLTPSLINIFGPSRTMSIVFFSGVKKKIASQSLASSRMRNNDTTTKLAHPIIQNLLLAKEPS